MKNQTLKTWLLAVVGVGLAAAPLNAATYIDGEITFTGGATLNGTLGNATAFTSFFGPAGPIGPPGSGVPVVAGATGSYAGVPGGTLATFYPFAFDVQPANPIQFWSFSVGPTTYSFEISSVTIAYQSSGFLNLVGQGTAYVTGFDPTPGNWSVADTGGNGPVFTFGNITVVPEPSTTLFVIGGFGLMLLTSIRRRK